MESIRQRRTIRKYQDKPIPAQLMDELLATACRASTMGGMQLYSIVITRDAAMRERLAPLHFNQPMVRDAAAVLTFCADFNRATHWCAINKADPGYDNFESFFNASIDALLVAQTFCTAAEEAGLGICYLGTTTYEPGKIIDLLLLPALVFPVATVTVGYPAEHPAQPDRLPLDGIVHDETYRDYTDDDIRRIYAYRESLEENKEFVRINGKETLAQVFTDCRYTRADNEAFSRRLLDALHRQRFI